MALYNKVSMIRRTTYRLCSLMILFMTVFSACTEDTELVKLEFRGEVSTFLQSFLEEADKREVQVDVSNLQINIESLGNQNVVGQCLSYTDGSKEVRIDEDKWIRSSALIKEFLLFHELGHCLLNRDHLNDKNEDGSCKSIMHASANSCRNTYSEASRKEYLDELFGSI